VRSILVPILDKADQLESLYAFTFYSDFEVICGTDAPCRFAFRRVETTGRSYVQAANLVAAAARGQELIFVDPAFTATSPHWKSDCFSIEAALFRQAGGFNEHFLEGCHEADLCRRLKLPDPNGRAAGNHVDRLLLADLWEP
jgi:hypothetical protein